MSSHSYPNLILRKLLTSYGVFTAFRDGNGKKQAASEETLLRMLEALGVETAGGGWEEAALARRCETLRCQGLTAPAVAWGEGPVRFSIWLEDDQAAARLSAEIVLSGGGTLAMALAGGKAGAVMGMLRRWTFMGAAAGPLPYGLHQLRLQVMGRVYEAPLIAAPVQCPPLPAAEGGGRWGLFVPVHALYRKEAPVMGTYGALAGLMKTAAPVGMGALLVLPLLPCYLDDPVELSPYAPVSRVFWSDAWLDPSAAAEWPDCKEAQAVYASPEAAQAAERFLREDLVDISGQYALRKRALSALSEAFFANGGSGSPGFQAFLAELPEARDYALFRAVCAAQGALWHSWPESLKARALQEEDGDPGAYRYHLYTQYLAAQQVRALKQTAAETGALLTLDLPLGCHSGGYDTWRHRSAFAWGVAVGAPPDGFFHEGQNWGFPPLSPESFLGEGLTYFAKCLDHHLSLGNLLRLDHVMGLQRLYWIPAGLSAKEGAYVKYPLEALSALVCLKAWERGCAVQGENLGTISKKMNQVLFGHGLYGTYVMPFEQKETGFRPPASREIASLATHDMPPLRGYLRGRDLEVLEDAGLCDEEKREELQAARNGFEEALWRLPPPGVEEEDSSVRLWLQSLEFLAGSEAPLVMVNASDLWQEKEPLNVPGLDSRYYPSWRRGFPLDLRDMGMHPCLRQAASLFSKRRRGN